MLRRETCKWLDERALGMEAEMDGGLWVSESPLAPLKGGDQRVICRCLPDIVADSPTARRLCKGYRLWVIERGCSERWWVMLLLPRRNAQITKINS